MFCVSTYKPNRTLRFLFRTNSRKLGEKIVILFVFWTLYSHKTGGIFGHHCFGWHGSNRSEINLDFSVFPCNSSSFPEQNPFASLFNWATNKLTFGGFDFNKRSNWKSLLDCPLLPDYSQFLSKRLYKYYYRNSVLTIHNYY